MLPLRNPNSNPEKRDITFASHFVTFSQKKSDRGLIIQCAFCAGGDEVWGKRDYKRFSEKRQCLKQILKKGVTG